MKGKMDIEDLFKEELGSEKLVPSSTSYFQSSIRHFARKFGLFVIGGTMVAAIGVAGLFYSESQEQSQKSKPAAAVDLFSGMEDANNLSMENIIQGGADSNVSDQAAVNISKDNSVTSATAGNVNEVYETTVSSNNQSQNFIPIAKTKTAKSQLVVDGKNKNKNKKATSSLKRQDGQANDKATAEVENNLKEDDKNQSSVGDQTETKESEKGTVALARGDSNENPKEQLKEQPKQQQNEVKKEDEVIKEGNLSKNSSVSTELGANAQGGQEQLDVGVILEESKPSEGEKEKLALADSAVQTTPGAEDIASEDSSSETTADKKKPRKLKFTLGALYNKHLSNYDVYDYSSSSAFTIQSGIKYPFLKDRFQGTVGIDFSSSQHHFIREDLSEGLYEEVQEIHILLRRIELPISIDYKLPIPGPIGCRLGGGIKLSEIFVDEEEALNKEDEIVFTGTHESFLVDKLEPILISKFVYLNVSKDIKKVRTNFQMYYYFSQFQMETYSETFVYDYFSLSSLRVGLSVDF